jgi:hypothetical protein
MKISILLIALYEIVMGIIGVIQIIGNYSQGYFQILIIMLFILSVIAGVFILARVKYGIILSLLVQALQIPHIVLAGFVFNFLAGPFFILTGTGFNHTGEPIEFGIASICNIGFISPLTAGRFGINIFAICIFVYLLRLRPWDSKIAKDENLFNNLSEERAVKGEGD